MAYRRNNFSFVADSSFRPYTMDEMLKPITMYENAYEKAEEAYIDLSNKAGMFKYLSETLPENSKARQIYEGYSDELTKRANDLAQNGLSIGNQSALTSLRTRYQGEIGRLENANKRMEEAMKLRNELSAKDPSLMYSYENFNIDDYLDNATPNSYAISGDDLYKAGTELGKNISSRYYDAEDGGSTLGGYYKMWTEHVGVSPENIAEFMQSPEVLAAVRQQLAARGVYDNLSTSNQRKAEQQILNGIYNGIVYQESVKPMKDVSKIEPAEAARIGLSRDQLNISMVKEGLRRDANGNIVYDPTIDPDRMNDEWMYNHDENGIRTGPSEAYKKFIAAGGKPGKAPSSSNTASRSTSTAKKQRDWKPRTGLQYNANGGANQFATTPSSTSQLGKRMTYAEVIEKYPNSDIRYHDLGFEDNYDYFVNGSGDAAKITPIPKSNPVRPYIENQEPDEWVTPTESSETIDDNNHSGL